MVTDFSNSSQHTMLFHNTLLLPPLYTVKIVKLSIRVNFSSGAKLAYKAPILYHTRKRLKIWHNRHSHRIRKMGLCIFDDNGSTSSGSSLAKCKIFLQ